ncbi:DNA polymerase III subunit delta [Aureimonas fodinaquatilis]|uniref:DNA-directed DNA polymerase n=1 Tax=Aureimonas fodinaquatilis TaxID=2565783 RepID=A0A5B0DSZ1_9HYPH|nr:DNA polymerase III subunit delta [Aureimonas fodinaquatilis]KAA0968239.1 DNA polymerase III subunit delta [Aureimonas fodinaquatilis]
MAQKKAGEVEAFLSRPDTSFPVLLLYGPDSGLVSERATKLAALSGVDNTDPFASIVLMADELEKSIGRLFDEAGTVSMFGGRRLIRIKGAGNGKALADAVADLASNPPTDTTIIIEAGELKKTAGLRVNAERGKAAMALPCYQDEARALDRLIDEELANASLTIDRAGREGLKARLGANRLASRAEVQKLCLYALGKSTISLSDVTTVVGDVSAETVDEAVDAAATGEVRKLPYLIERLISAGVSGFQLQNPLLRYFQQLLLMREELEKQGLTASDVVARKRVHFSRARSMELALANWPVPAISSVLSRLEADILQSRKEAILQQSIMHRTLMEISVEAARLRARR